MWELRYLNSCLRQLVSCKSPESPQIQQGYWLLCNLRYSNWKQLCLGVLNWTESSIWEGIMWIFCQRNPKVNRSWWEFFFSFFSTPFLSLCGWKNCTLQQRAHCETFQKTFSAASLENLNIILDGKHHSRKKTNHWPMRQAMYMVIVENMFFHFSVCNFEYLHFLISQELCPRLSRCTCLLSEDSHVFTFQKLWHGICCHVLWHCLTDFYFIY